MRRATNGAPQRRVTIVMPEELYFWLKSQEQQKGFRSFSGFLSVVLSGLRPHIKGLRIGTDVPMEEDPVVAVASEGENNE